MRSLPLAGDEAAAGDGPAGGLIERVERLRSAAGRPHWRRLILLGAVAFLVIGSVIAWQARPDDVSAELNFVMLGLSVALAAPLHVALNGAELMVMARISRKRMKVTEAARVTILSSAANLLPVPGAVLIRTRALQRLGTTGRHALSVTVVVGLGWVATACALAGVLVGIDDPGAPALVFGIAGVAGLSATWVLMARYPAPRARAFAELVAVEALSSLVGGVRVWLAIRGMGYDANLATGIALSLSGPLSSLVGIFPGGLGLREAIAAALAPAVGIAASVALLATIVDRIIGAVVQAAMGVIMVVVPSLRRAATSPDSDVAVEPEPGTLD